MKSEKAKQYIDNRTITKSTVFFHDINVDVAYQAIDIAEIEIIERAIEAHFTTCPHNDGGRCKLGGFLKIPCSGEYGGCDFMQKFIQQLDKQK